jgi:DNA-binding CsgD family transcriptional regulator
VSSVGKPLSPREARILALLCDGLETPQIATRFHISENTVKSYKARLYEKLGARTAAHAVHLAYQAGLLGAAQADDLAVLQQARELGYRLALAPLAGGAR